MPLSQFDPNSFPWPNYPSSFKEHVTFRSLADMVLELKGTTVYYIDVSHTARG